MTTPRDAGSGSVPVPGPAPASASGSSSIVVPPPPAAWKLVATLGGAGALSGLLLVTVYDLTRPAILAHREAQVRAAVDVVLQGPTEVDELFVVDGTLRAERPAAGTDLVRVWRGRDADGALLGYALDASGPGYQDGIHLLFGYDANSDRLLGMTVLQSKETPGLGDRIEKDPSFAAGFVGGIPPLVGVKPGENGDEHGVDMITGATISSRAVISALNAALAPLRPVLRAAPAEVAPSPDANAPAADAREEHP